MPSNGRDAALKTYIRKVRTGVKRQLNNWQAQVPHDNFPLPEGTALKNLQQQNYIIIKHAD